ncbi:hypothetical protein FRB97_008322 [Tulasnella sp. 331]|nr:hypothetical protein FRB97_008322 [Tulasnella sp. 331]
MEIHSFGSKRNFWVKYDHFSTAFDKDMVERLNTNLDAGLFSAVNTAFIVVALTALSANPADETNHLLRLLVMNVSNYTLTENDLNPPFAPTTSAVRQNCTFFASLCCSLLAAAGAVLAKQWLQFYMRTEKKGSIDHQAMKRTEKFAGVEDWGLGLVVETLATLLLVSLSLFFIALVDYLWVVDKTVALVVLVFAASGTVLYITMVVVAAIFKACPFQTGPSMALRQPGSSAMYASRWSAQNVFLLLDANIPLQQEPNGSKLQSLRALSTIFIAESAPEPANLLAVAENIPLISDFDAVRLISDSSSAFQSLLSQLQDTLRSLENSYDDAAMADAITLARAIAHVVLADPKGTLIATRTFFSDLGNIETNPPPRWVSSKDLVLYLVCAHNINRFSRPSYRLNRRGVAIRMSDGHEAIGYALHRALQKAKWNLAVTGPQADLQYSAAAFWLRHVIITAAYNLWEKGHMDVLIEDISKVALLEGLAPNSAYLSLSMSALIAIIGWYPLWHARCDDTAALAVRVMGVTAGFVDKRDESLKDAWSASLSCHSIADQLLDTLDAFHNQHDYAQKAVPYRDWLLMQINALYPSFHMMLHESPSATPPTSLVTRIHSSLNSNIEQVLGTRWSRAEVGPILPTGEGELVRTLHSLLLTSAPLGNDARRNLDTTASLALRVSSPMEKEQLLQSILYTLLLDLEGGSNPLPGSPDEHNLPTRHRLLFTRLRSWLAYTLPVSCGRPERVPSPDARASIGLEKRRERLQDGRAVGPILTSTLRLFVWLYPTITPEQAWAAFDRYLYLIAFGEQAFRYRMEPVSVYRTNVWNAALATTQEDLPRGHQSTGSCMLWLASRGTARLEELDKERMVQWFKDFIEETGDVDAEDTIPAETSGRPGTVDRMCAGILFLEVWQADDMASTLSQPSKWTSPGAIDAFAAWLRTYDGSPERVVEVKLEDVVLVQATVDLGLVTRFINHAFLVNPLAVDECALQSILQGVLSRADEDRRAVSEAGIQPAGGDTAEGLGESVIVHE